MAAGTGTARTGTGEPRPEKVAVVTEVRERLSSSNGALLTEYRGLKVADLARLRHSLRESGGEYGIYKNTLVRRAAVDLGLDDMVDLLVGPTAIAFVTGDPVAVAKSLRDFAKTSPNLVVKGGLLGKKVLTAAEATALADVAPREVVLAQLAGALAAPLVKMAGLLQALPRNFAYGLKALLDQKAADEPAPAAEAPARSGGGGRARRPRRSGGHRDGRARHGCRRPSRPPAETGPGRDRHSAGRHGPDRGGPADGAGRRRPPTTRPRPPTEGPAERRRRRPRRPPPRRPSRRPPPPSAGRRRAADDRTTEPRHADAPAADASVDDQPPTPPSTTPEATAHGRDTGVLRWPPRKRFSTASPT